MKSNFASQLNGILKGSVNSTRVDLRFVATLLVHLEHIHAGSGRSQDYLLAIQHECLRRNRKATDLRVPNRRSGLRVPCREVLTVIGKQQASGCREQPDITAAELMPPHHLAGSVVDGVDKCALVHSGGAAFAAEAH